MGRCVDERGSMADRYSFIFPLFLDIAYEMRSDVFLLIIFYCLNT
jgi:hypothetical protein